MKPSAKALSILAASLAVQSPASAGSDHSLNGRWVADLDTQAGLPTDVYVIANGDYSCESCTPPRRYPADGRMHPVGPAGTRLNAPFHGTERTLWSPAVRP